MNVSIRHLRAALAVARHESFRRAAEELHLSQPALSLAVSQLEENLGVTLFDRTSRMVRPTEVGTAFLGNAARLMADFESLVTDIGNVRRSRRGRVVVSCLTSVTGRIMPLVLAACHRRFPEVELVIRDEVATKVMEMVRSGEVDLGLAMSWHEPIEGTIFEPLLRDAFQIVCPKDHRFAAMKTVRWSDIAGETFIAFAPNSGSHAVVNAQLLNQDIKVARMIVVSQLAAVQGMLEAGLGISVLPRLAHPVPDHPTLTSRPLIRPALDRIIGLIRRTDRSLSPAAAAFREVLRDTVREGPQFVPIEPAPEYIKDRPNA